MIQFHKLTFLLFIFVLTSAKADDISNYYGLWEVYDVNNSKGTMTSEEKSEVGDWQFYPIIKDKIHLTPEASYYIYAKNNDIRMLFGYKYKINDDGKLSVFRNNQWEDGFWFENINIYLKKDSSNKMRVLYISTDKSKKKYTITVYLKKINSKN